jgi:signal transduction histidine kinase/CheY-like chemotaxis protein
MNHAIMNHATPLLLGLWPAAWSAMMAALDPLTVVTPLVGIAATLIWATRIHFRALRQIKECQNRMEELTLQKEAAESAGMAKDDFLAKLSHEIRTPMDGIISFAELAMKTELTEQQRHYLDTVLNSAEWLTRVVSDVLDFTRMESVRHEIESREFNLAQCVSSAVQIIEPRAAEKSLSISCKIDPRIPGAVCGDPVRIRQVLVNLLENAVRFTSSGSIMLSVALEEESTAEVGLSIAVADTGIGIPAERQHSIFEPFQGTSRSDHRLASGAGLGLSICKKLIEMMNGSIEVQSQIGAGSTFRFTARLKKVQKPEERTEQLEILGKFSAKRLSVLLAEANGVSRRFTAKLLESAGHQITPAATGKEALEVFSADIFDLILMDLDMPDMDGLNVALNLRELETDMAHTPIYALVPAARANDTKEYLKSGIDGFISMPVQMDELLRVVGEVAGSTQPLRTPVLV